MFVVARFRYKIASEGSKLNSICRPNGSCLWKRPFNTAKLLSIQQVNNTSARPSIQKPFTVLIEGNIASGKTGFINHFKDIDGIQISEEPVEKWRNVPGGHNALALMYEDPRRWSLTLQTYIQLTMMQAHINNENTALKLMERSIHSARYIFSENLYKSGLMADVDYVVLDEWYRWITSLHDCNADLVIYLRTKPETCLRRLHARGREEEQSVPLSYLKSIHDLYENWLIGKSNPHWIVPKNVQVVDANSNLDEMAEMCREQRDKIVKYVSSQ